MRASLSIALWALVAGCGPAEVAECPSTLVDHFRWALVPESGAVGSKGPCNRNDITTEFFGAEPSVSVDTTGCSAATLEQPTQLPIAAGDNLHLRIYHYPLTSTVSGVGHLEVALGATSLWTREVPLPSDSQLFEADVILPEAAAAGTPIRWHVDNHGNNTWNMVELSVMAPCAQVE